MTIITKPLTTEKKAADKSGQKPLVENQINESRSGSQADLESNLTPRVRRCYFWTDDYYRNEAARRNVNGAATLCLALLALFVLTMGFMSGLYIYRHMGRMQVHKYNGWCTIPYSMEDQPRAESYFSDSRLMKANKISADYANNAVLSGNAFREEFDIDEDNNVQRITVPDFRNGRPGRFIHDFNSEKTAIVDLKGRRCFVMPLNRDSVLLPRSLFDLVNKMFEGYYDVNTDVIRNTMRVVIPPITDYSSLGVYITKECRNLPTYKLEKMTVPVYKRSADQAIFGEFAGNNIQEFNILNFAAIEEYERNNPIVQTQGEQ